MYSPARSISRKPGLVGLRIRTEAACGVHEEDGNPFQLEALYRAESRWLVAFLRRRFGREQAEDLAQETFIRASGVHVELRNPRAFLAKIALNAARDVARREAVRPVFAAEDLNASVGPGQAESLLLKQVILAMPAREREVFLLSRFAGLTYAEIAHRCGVSVKSVEARMNRALAVCAARIRG